MAKPPAKKAKPAGPTGHKRFGSSNSKQWLTCSGAPALIESLPPHERKRSDTIWSKRGTCAHAVGEMSLVSYVNSPAHATEPEDYLGQLVEGVIVDQEIVDGAQVYVEWARKIIDRADHVEIERGGSLYNFITGVQGETGDFLSLNGHDYGGTGDFVAAQYFGPLDVGDYKNGRGYVDEKDNSQVLIYALEALVELGAEYDFDEVRLTIIQPNGPGNAVRTWTVSPEYVFKWAMTVLLPGAERVIEAIQRFAEIQSVEDEQDWASAYLVADLEGHCTFCPAKSRCIAALNVTCDVAMLEFQSEVDFFDGGPDELLLKLPSLALITPEQEALLLQHADGIIDFIKAVQERAHAKAERGEAVPGYKLVEKGGTRRKYIAPDDAIKTSCKKLGLVPHDYMDAPTLKSPAQLEKSFKAKGVNPALVKEFMAKHVGKNESGVALVKESDPREPIQCKLEHEFAHLVDKPDDWLEL